MEILFLLNKYNMNFIYHIFKLWPTINKGPSRRRYIFKYEVYGRYIRNTKKARTQTSTQAGSGTLPNPASSVLKKP
jgi:hypothetical protein